MNYISLKKHISTHTLYTFLFLMFAVSAMMYQKPVQAATTQATTPTNTVTTTTTTVRKTSIKVSCSHNLVKKGSFATPIWEQHKIWGAKSSAGRHGCGVVCTSMALNLSGVATTPNETLTELGRTVQHCGPVLAKEAVACFQKNGVNAVAYNTKGRSNKSCMNIMRQALKQGKIVMLYIKGKPFSNGIHWILLTGYSKSGKIVVANSSYGSNHVCQKSGKQYHILTWNKITKRIYRGKTKYTGFIVIG